MYDISTLTLGEVAKVEDLSGQSIGSIGEDSAPKGKALAALAFVVARRTGRPQLTWNEALGFTMEEASEILGLDDDADEPTDVPDLEEEEASGN